MKPEITIAIPVYKTAKFLPAYLDSQYSAQTFAAMLNLGSSEKKTADYRIGPSDDGETFVPFFRNSDHLFRKLPAGFRKKLFGKLAEIYNRITGN